MYTPEIRHFESEQQFITAWARYAQGLPVTPPTGLGDGLSKHLHTLIDPGNWGVAVAVVRSWLLQFNRDNWPPVDGKTDRSHPLYSRLLEDLRGLLDAIAPTLVQVANHLLAPEYWWTNVGQPTFVLRELPDSSEHLMVGGAGLGVSTELCVPTTWLAVEGVSLPRIPDLLMHDGDIGGWVDDHPWANPPAGCRGFSIESSSSHFSLLSTLIAVTNEHAAHTLAMCTHAGLVEHIVIYILDELYGSGEWPTKLASEHGQQFET